MSQHATLLIMTDDPNQRLALSEFLGYDYHILTAEHGQEGSDILARPGTQVDVLITELSALKTTGLELITHTKQDDPSLPILIIKSVDTPPLSPQLADQTRFIYIPEPFTYDELKAQIERAIKHNTSGAGPPVVEFPNMIQLLCVSQAKVALTVVHDVEAGQEEQGKIYFEHGNVTNASCGKRKGEEGLYYMMQWDSPRFFPRYGVAVKHKAIQKDWETLLANVHTATFEASPSEPPPSEQTEEDVSPDSDIRQKKPGEQAQERSSGEEEAGRVSPQLQKAVFDILEELQSQFDGMEMALVVDLHGNLVSSLSNEALQSKRPLLNSLFQETLQTSTALSQTLQLGTVEELVIMGQQQEIAMLFPITDFGTLGVVVSKGSQGMVRWNCTEAIEKIQGLTS